MDCRTTFTENSGLAGNSRVAALRPARTAAFSLVELMVALGISSLLLTVIASLTYYSTRSIASMANYVDLDDKSRNALDRMTRDIRQVDFLSAYSTNQLVFQDFDGTPLTFAWDPNSKRLTRTKSGLTETLLTECETLTFTIYQRNPIAGTYDQYPVATNNFTNTCKLVQVNWTCSRKILATRANTESVQTAKIVIRKQ